MCDDHCTAGSNGALFGCSQKPNCSHRVASCPRFWLLHTLGNNTNKLTLYLHSTFPAWDATQQRQLERNRKANQTRVISHIWLFQEQPVPFLAVPGRREKVKAATSRHLGWEGKAGPGSSREVTQLSANVPRRGPLRKGCAKEGTGKCPHCCACRTTCAPSSLLQNSKHHEVFFLLGFLKRC